VTAAEASSELRARCDALVADTSVGGAAFGAALAAVIDASILDVLDRAAWADVAVLALGSYARRELCPGSDLDVLLVHEPGAPIGELADALWYPLWDAGFVLGHATRTVKESRKLAAKDRDTLTALLDARVIGGNAAELGTQVVADVRKRAVANAPALVARLADDSVLRELRPGPIAEMLEPNLKDGAGGLRDLHALDWAGWCHGGPGRDGLVASQTLEPDDGAVLRTARDRLLEVRVALHRTTGRRSDVLALQDQDAVAAMLGRVDADDLMRRLAESTRAVAWIAADVWARSARRRSGRRPEPRPVAIEPGIVELDGRVAVEPDRPLDANVLLRVARCAADRNMTIDRATLRAGRDARPPQWNTEARADLVALLRSGRALIEVVAALDHEDLVTLLLPEWAGVRSRPQRNAYHRFTVDRHLVETVAEAVALLDEPAQPLARAAREVQRVDLLLLGALLHDIAKGRSGDHSDVGAAVAASIGVRIGLDAPGVDTLTWLVRDHLAMADTATRRDLADPVTISRFAARVGDVERLRLLALLTVADSRATGPAAWGPGKAALVEELYERTLAHWTGAPIVPDPSAGEDDAALAGPGVVVEWSELGDGRLRCAVGAPDRPGLLADVAGALSLEGFDIDAAEGHSLAGGRAAEVFDGTDPLARLDDGPSRARAAATIRGVLAGELPVTERLRARRTAYRGDAIDPAAVRIVVAPDESAAATVVEVYAPDAVGLLATVARVFFEANLDVTTVRAATTGELAVDVFYVRDDGSLAAPARVEALDRALRDALGRD
jgi:[protein-PII] uridylyltransferase